MRYINLTPEEIKQSINNFYGNIVSDVQFSESKETLFIYGYPRFYKKLMQVASDHVKSGMTLANIDYPNKTPYSDNKFMVLTLKF